MSAKPSSTSRKREDILDAAVEAFQQDGYEKTSMDRIADLANASKRTVYNHFDSKAELFQQVLTRLFAELSVLKDIPWNSELPLAEQLEAFARAKLAMQSNPSWLRLSRVAFAEFIHQPDLARETMERIHEREDSLVQWLREAHKADGLRVPDPELSAQVFWGAVSGSVVWPAILGQELPEHQVDRLVAALVDTFLRAHRA